MKAKKRKSKIPSFSAIKTKGNPSNNQALLVLLQDLSHI